MGKDVQVHIFIPSAPDGDESSASRTARLPPQQKGLLVEASWNVMAHFTCDHISTGVYPLDRTPVGIQALFGRHGWKKIFCLPRSRTLSICSQSLYCASPAPYLLSAWCRVLLEKLTGLQLVKKFPAFHETRRFITALTSIRHLSLSWASPIQSVYPHPTSWRSILILSTDLRLGLPSGLFPHTET